LFSHTGDGVVAAFASPRSAVDAAVAAQRALELPVRMGIATGEAELREADYFGTVLKEIWAEQERPGCRPALARRTTPANGRPVCGREAAAKSQPAQLTSTAAVDRDVRRFGVSALVGAVTAASFGVCEDN
jgi:hypothetical protein